MRQPVKKPSLLTMDQMNTMSDKDDRVAIPLAGDDPGALKVASQLVEDAGFDPVVVGPLSRAKDFDVGTPVYARALTARELRQQLEMD